KHLPELRLREHTVLVERAVVSGFAREVDEDVLPLVGAVALARLVQGRLQVRRPREVRLRCWVRQEEGVHPGIDRPRRPLLLAVRKRGGPPPAAGRTPG